VPRTYLIFGDIEGKLDVLRVECTKCSRKGRYSVRSLIEKYGRLDRDATGYRPDGGDPVGTPRPAYKSAAADPPGSAEDVMIAGPGVSPHGIAHCTWIVSAVASPVRAVDWRGGRRHLVDMAA